MKGKRKRGRQKKRWEDNIKECTGMDFASSTRKLKTGQDGKGLLRIHLWCPDDLPRLWNGIENRIDLLSNCYAMVCPPVQGDNPRKPVDYLLYRRTTHDIIISYHPPQCRPCSV